MKFKFEFYRICSKKLPKAFDGLKIVFLTDLHNCAGRKDNLRLYKKILKISPDIILIGGDMVVGRPGFKKFKKLAGLYSMLAKHFPVFYGFGNHEKRLSVYESLYGTRFGDYLKMMERRGIHILDNRSIYLKKNNESLKISSINADLDFFGGFWRRREMPEDYMEKCLGAAGEEYEILLAHHPRYFEQYVKWGADLVLSGHIHGGVLRLPLIGGVVSPDITFFPKYSGGMWKKGDTTMIVSRGMGEHTIPVRLFNPREVSVVELKSCAVK